VERRGEKGKEIRKKTKLQESRVAIIMI